MAEINATGAPQQEFASGDTRVLSIITYGLLLAGWPTLHLATIAAVILAYIKRGEARGTIWESHFSNVIHTFWISLLIGVVVFPLCLVLIGIPLMGLLIVWFLYRTIKGLVQAIDNKPYI